MTCSKSKETPVSFNAIRTVVTGEVLNLHSEKPDIRLVINRVGFGEEEIRTRLDSLSQFKFEFTTYVPVDAWLTYPTNFLILLKPGDSLHVVWEADRKDRPELLETIQFAGNSAEVNRQASRFQQLYYASDLYFYGPGHEKGYRRLQNAFKHFGPDQFKTFADSIKEEEISLLETNLGKDEINEFVQTWATYFIERNYYEILSFYPREHINLNALAESEWSIPLTYYDYYLKPQNIDNALQSGDAVNAYLNKYSAYLSKLTSRELSYLENESESAPSLAIDSTMLNLIMKNTSPGLFREAMITYAFNHFLDYSRMESFEKYKVVAENNIHAEYLKAPLFDKYELTRKTIARTDSVNFIRVKTLENFLPGIVAKNKGQKITYVDVWATWCGPCRAEFPFSKALQDEFAKDVDFVFVCVDSDMGSYTNTLKEFQLTGTHYFLNKSQSKAFQQELKMEGVPQYLIINQAGRIVSSGFAYRPSEALTKETIKALIKE